jgi:4'-phosphopantetheinyl transferase
MANVMAVMPEPDLNLPYVIRGNGVDQCEILATRLDVAPQIIRESTALLSSAERQRASRFAFDRDRARFTVARARLRQLLATRLCVRPELIEFVCGPRGKPALSQCFSDADLHFNVSYSNDVGVYAFANGREIGVDVEAIHLLPDADDIAARLFSRRECEAYRNLDQPDKLVGFFNCWTRKEAFIKAVGEGFSYPMRQFDVSLAPHEPARILRVGELSGADCGWCLQNLELWPHYAAAVVIENVPAGNRIARAFSKSRIDGEVTFPKAAASPEPAMSCYAGSGRKASRCNGEAAFVRC